MSISRRDFVALGLGLAGSTFIDPLDLIKSPQPVLDQAFINRHKRIIEAYILKAMESVYYQGGELFTDSYRSEYKYIERVVSYYDYGATGISVLASLVSEGNQRAVRMMKQIQKNIRYYHEYIHGTDVGGHLEGRVWNVPLRRLLLHIALAYKVMEPNLNKDEKRWYSDLADQQVTLAIQYNENFFPGETRLKRTNANNHTAIFMQGIYYCGLVFNRPEWVQMMKEFAGRMYDCIRPDGYFEENTNEAHEGGPSMVYTRLTLGCLYDVLDGKNYSQEKFVNAGNFYRSFVNHRYEMISIADERTNCHNAKGLDYGLALHSLTPRGRYYIKDNLDNLDYKWLSIESLAVIYHELDLMKTGECEIPENRLEGNSRIELPLGIVRKNGFTAGLSALMALNRLIRPDSDYALDQQNMVYLSNEKAGLILTGYKSKNDPRFSTFRINDDAYTIRTGELEMGNGWAEATLYYKTFTAKIRWEIGDTAKLILLSDTDRVITTSLTVVNEKYIKTGNKFDIVYLDGFSPYTESNRAEKIKTVVFNWSRELVVEFIC